LGGSISDFFLWKKPKGETDDLWIAATALHHGLPLVTNDHGELARVDHLQAIRY